VASRTGRSTQLQVHVRLASGVHVVHALLANGTMLARTFVLL